MTMLHTRTDGEIQRDVLHALKIDPRVDETDVGVQVSSGVVALVGTIDSHAKKHAACEAAHRVPGVLDVVDELVVRVQSAWKKPDVEIARMVRQALVWESFAPDQDVRSTVAHGWVTLEGEVEYAYQAEDAVKVVEALDGVRGVTNEIRVGPQPADAASIRASILEALGRQTEREARHIEIHVAEGIVSLRGRVRSLSEKNAVENVARHAPGIRGVHDLLVVDAFS